MHNWNVFGARTSHEHTRTHKIHHGLDLGETTNFPLIVFFMIGHRGPNVIFPKIPKSGIPKFPKLGLMSFWMFITSFANLQLKWGRKQSYNPCWNLSNDMWHSPCMHIFQGNSWLLMVGSQRDTLTPNLSFGHNLCWKYSNESIQTHFKHLRLKSFLMV